MKRLSAQNFALQQSACSHLGRKAVFQCWGKFSITVMPEGSLNHRDSRYCLQICLAGHWFRSGAERTIDEHVLGRVRNLMSGSQQNSVQANKEPYLAFCYSQIAHKYKCQDVLEGLSIKITIHLA